MKTRTARKLAEALATVTQRLEVVETSNPFPEHAPTACYIRGKRVREIMREFHTLAIRATRLEEEDASRELRRSVEEDLQGTWVRKVPVRYMQRYR
jgi:hypothetical protein